jgi:spore maturation protein CgeB
MGNSSIHCSHGRAVPSEFQPPEVTSEQLERFGADVSFVGRYFACRDEFFEQFGRRVRIWGDQWSEQSKLSYGNEIIPIDPAEKPTVFACSKINLHLRAGHQQINAFSTRVFEIPLCGGFVLAEWSLDLENCFEIGHEIAVFKTPDECRELTDYYLQHEDERHAMTGRLRNRIMKDYTLTEAVANVSDLLVKMCRPDDT